MRQARVAIVYDVLYPWVRGGAEKRFWEIARRLPAHGFEPHLIGPKYWDGPAAVQREGVWLHGICAPRELYGGDGNRAIGEAIGFARDLLPALLRLHVDLIDCCAFPYFPWFSARAVAALRGVPILTTWPELWGPYWRSYLGPVKGSIAQLVEAATVRMSSRHLCLSPFTEDRLRQAAGAHARIVPIPAGIEAAALARYAAPDDERNGIIYIGRLLAHKRVADLLQAFAVVRGNHPDLRLTIVGSGPEGEALRERAEQLDLMPHISFLSDLDEDALYSRLGRARCLVLPSEREGQGIVVAEAQATGTPPIVAAGAETAATDFVTHGVSGWVYPAADVAALSRIVKLALGADGGYTEVARGAHQAAARLDWDAAILPRVAGLYRTLLRGEAAPTHAAQYQMGSA